LKRLAEDIAAGKYHASSKPANPSHEAAQFPHLDSEVNRHYNRFRTVRYENLDICSDF